jgi:serine protease Do
MATSSNKNDASAEGDKAYSVSSNTNKYAGNDDWYNLRVPKLKRPDMARFDGLRRRASSAAVAVALIVGLIAGFLGGLVGASVHDNGVGVGSSLSAQKKIVTSQSQLISQIAKTVGPSVVSVDVTSQTTNSNGFDSLFGFGGGTSQQQSAGTGIIINSDGLILTNRHVVPAGTTSVSVTLSDGTQLKDVKVLGRTNDSDSLDVAFLKISDAQGHKLTPAVIGDSSQVQVGDSVVAIGNALGQFQNTVTSGIISGFGRSVEAGDSSGSQASENLDDLFQTDAAINEGNSGGPLVNLNGQVIGINTAIASDSQSIGFAIPINDITGLIRQVEQTGSFQRPYLGVRYVTLTPDVADQYNVDATSGGFIPPSVDSSSPSIISGSPAEKAGLQEGDVITSIDGSKIDSTHSLTSIIDKHSVGDNVSLTVVRDGKTLHVSATLEAAPSS